MAFTFWLGLLLTALAGLFSGVCMLPMKFAKHWPWENTWLVFTVVSLLILPWTLAFATVHDLPAIYAALPASVFVAPLLFGFGWGIAQVLFGISIARLGVALGYAIVVGLGAMLGTLVPLFVRHREILATGRGTLIFCGVGIMLLGIAVSARAGKAREGSTERVGGGASYGVALMVAVLCGLMAPMLNFAFAFGQGIAEEAVRQGASPSVAGYAVWPIALLGGLIPNSFYAVWLLTRNRTWRHFSSAWSPDVWFGCLMGVLWMGAFAIYGVSSVYLGALGTSAGWGLFQIFMIITANLSGVLSGEWKDALPAAKKGLWTGLALLGVATAAIALGNR
jgi:L-rhamnose-H+ transport protein